MQNYSCVNAEKDVFVLLGDPWGWPPVWAKCCQLREGGKGGDESCHRRGAQTGVRAKMW